MMAASRAFRLREGCRSDLGKGSVRDLFVFVFCLFYSCIWCVSVCFFVVV